MNRNQKLGALRAVLTGSSVCNAFPVIDLLLIESDDRTEIIGSINRTVKNSQVSLFLAKVRELYPYKVLKVCRMAKVEYEAIRKKLESEY